MTLENVNKKIRRNERLTKEEGLFIFRNAELLDLGALANEIRFKKNPEPWVTYIIDTNPNYSNICNVDCKFCAFHKHLGEAGAYRLTVDEIIKKLKDAINQGATTALLQGGVDPNIPFEYYLEIVERTIKEVPNIYAHYFSTPEINVMAQVANLSIEEVLQKLWDKGLRSLPGGGAEILSDRVKKKISRKKGTSADWLNIMRIAHKIGYKSTATMMYGHIENDEDIVEHLEAIRQLQDDTNGFTAFIPWSFKPGNTPLEKIFYNYATPTRYLQIISFSRIYLDNFQHIQASWFSEGKKIGQIALHFGADDFGGTLLEENVHAAANYVNVANIEECKNLINEAGFIPAQRTTLYRILKVDKTADAA